MVTSVSHTIWQYTLSIITHFSRIPALLLSGFSAFSPLLPALFAMSIIVHFLDPRHPNTHLGYPGSTSP
jgi:hypothetical protein